MNEFRPFHHDPFTCPRCAYVMDASTALDSLPDTGGPDPGTISLCMQCGAFLLLIAAPPLSRSRLAARLAVPADLATLGTRNRRRLERVAAHVHAWRGHPPV